MAAIMKMSQDEKTLETILEQCLSIILEVIECLTYCIQHTCHSSNDGVHLQSINSLPSTVIHVVKESYNHCKESTTLYGNTFHLVSATLSQLFKKSFELEKLLLTLLHVVELSGTEDDVQSITEVCNGLFNICNVISSVDDTVLLRTWKSLVELSTKQKLLLRDRLEVSNMIKMLCQEILLTYEYLLQLACESSSSQNAANDKIFGRKFKVCRFYVNMLMTLVKEFDGYLGPCYQEVYKLILSMQSMSPPSLYASSTMQRSKMQDMKQSLLVFIEPLVHMMLPSRGFAEIMTNKVTELTPELWFPHINLMSQIMTELSNQKSDVIDLWLVPRCQSEDAPRDSIIACFFHSIPNCYVELSLPLYMPGIMCDGKPYREVSFYEHVCVKLCGFIAALPSSYFHVVEKCVFDNLVNQNLFCKLLAMDVCCFISRWGSDDIRLHYVNYFAELLISLPDVHTTMCVVFAELLNRLISFLSDHQQNDFLSKFSSTQYPALWSCISLSVFKQGDCKQNIINSIMKDCVREIQAWISSLPKTNSSLEELTVHLRLLCNVMKQTAPFNISTQLQTSLNEIISTLWEVLSLRQISSDDVISVLIRLSTYNLPYLQSAHLTKVVSGLLVLLSFPPPVSVKLSITEFLRHFNKKEVTPGVQQRQILTDLPQLFSDMLNDTNVVVHQRALEAFSIFAEETVYEQIVPQCLQKGNIQDIVVNFLNKIPFADDDSLPTNVEVLKNQQTAVEYLQRDKCDDGEKASVVGTRELIEPFCKRTKYDDSAYREAVNSIEENVNHIMELKDVIPPPDWLTDELQKIQEKLKSLSSC
uniref:Uncharacterized protein C1orf112-like n=1 Tax=Saccoglossus kowalevskii TaxID=10224 RepID=A0ABM0MP44_SACKO|nr:PREDICTED: uncharacterized protein C1orf112-like [Saccoglossus kowalevskii]